MADFLEGAAYSPSAKARGGQDCRYRSPDTDPEIDPNGTADETADGIATGLR
jgi:hypothetical protein